MVPVVYPYMKLDTVPPFETIDRPDQSLPPPFIERIFRFQKDSLSKLKARANFEARTDTFSTLQAFLAHTWRAMIRSRGVVHLHQQVVCARYHNRHETEASLPDVYFENAIYKTLVSMESKNLVHKVLRWAALEMNKVVKAQTRDQVLQDIGKNVEVINTDPEVAKTDNVFDVDFGWAKPAAIRNGPASKYDRKINVYPSGEDGGIDVEVCLAEESLVAMGNDTEFMEAFTTL